jgi:hypothetical protein
VYPLNTVLVGAYPLNTVLVGEYPLNTVLVGAYPLYTVNTPYSLNTYLEGPPIDSRNGEENGSEFRLDLTNLSVGDHNSTMKSWAGDTKTGFSGFNGFSRYSLRFML